MVGAVCSCDFIIDSHACRNGQCPKCKRCQDNLLCKKWHRPEPGVGPPHRFSGSSCKLARLHSALHLGPIWGGCGTGNLIRR